MVEAFRLSPEQIEGWKNYYNDFGYTINASGRNEYYRLEHAADPLSSKTRNEFQNQ